MKFRYMNRYVYLLFYLFLMRSLVAVGPMDQIGLSNIDLSDIDGIDGRCPKCPQ